MRFTTSVAIQQGTEVRDASGGVSYTFAAVQGLGRLFATIMPFTDELRQERYTEAEGHWLIVLMGHYPQITTSHWVLHDGVRYEIERVSTTKMHKVTTLSARLPTI